MDQDKSQEIINLPFNIQAQYIKDLSFENPNPVDIMTDQTEEQPTIAVDIQVKAKPLTDYNYEVLLIVHANAQRNQKQMYVLELVYGGIVSHSAELPKDLIPQVVMIYAPTMMFPFVRNIVCDTTREGGYIPLMLSPVDFMELYERQANAQKNNSAENFEQEKIKAKA